ncbi:MAG: elongation factor G [Bacteroidales bacterium]
MKTYKPNEIRNIAVIGSSGSGKTSLTEAMLYKYGVISKKGTVSNNNTISDFHPIEHSFGKSVFPSLMCTEIEDCKINFIDTPGMSDFVGGVASALSVVSTSLMVVNAAHGVEAGTEVAYRMANTNKTPIIFAFNFIDSSDANYDKTLDEVNDLVGKNKPVVIQFPVSTGPDTNAIIDVLKMTMCKYTNGKREMVDIPDEFKDRAAELHNALVEKAAENDEELMEKYFDKGELSEDELRKGIKLGMADNSLYPIFCCSAEKEMGVYRIMEFIKGTVPSPVDVKPKVDLNGGEPKREANAPTSIFIYKVDIEQHVGEVTYFKVISGTVKEGLDLINTNNDTKERLSQIFTVEGKNRTKAVELQAGDLGATVKLKNSRANHTLCEKGISYKFEPIKFPTPLYTVAIKAENEAEDEKMGECLTKLSNEDPTFVIEHSKELRQILVHCRGEHHLSILHWYFDNVFNMKICISTPRIAYRETITKIAQADYRHKKQSGGAGQFGEVHIVIEPYEDGMPSPASYNINGKETKVSLRNTDEHTLPWGGKLVFCNCIVGGAIDARFLPAILKGIMEKMEEGPLTGSYARDIRVCVYDGKMHQVDSNELSFKLAGRNAFSAAFKNAAPRILEPIYDISVRVPSDKIGDVMSDLQTRRAIIMGMDSEYGYEKIEAKVPLKEIAKYSTALSSLSQGRGVFSIKFSNYEKVPTDIQEELIANYEKEESEV